MDISTNLKKPNGWKFLCQKGGHVQRKREHTVALG